jgi:putative hydrolase of the HAD superfamily
VNDVRIVLFDLDDTLYTNSSGLFREVGQRIESWTAQTLGLTLEDAKALRSTYYTRYGTTMAGLVKEHPDVDVDIYLDYVHDVDVAQYLAPNPALQAMLAALTVRKAIFTNSIKDWAERVTRQLGVREHFEAIYDVRATDYRSKPDPHTYERVLAALDVPGDACVMLDDQPAYLRGAHRYGIRTILVSPEDETGDGVDYAVAGILEAEPILKRLLADGGERE